MNLPLNTAPYYNTDQIANSIAANDMIDCYLEPVPELGFVTRRRPGLKLFCDLGTDVKGDGLFFWEAPNRLIAVSGGKVFNVNQDGSFAQLSGAVPIPGTCTFADGQKLDGTPWLYIAATNLTYTTDGIALQTPSDPGTPLTTHIGWINSKFVTNVRGTNQFLFTDTNPSTGLLENDYWSSTDNPIVCESKGDTLAALFVAWQEVYAWGTEGLQIFQDDGVSPFVNIPGAFAEIGIEAVYSIVRSDNTVFALCVVDGKRVVVKMVNRAPAVISEPIGRILADMPTVSDAVGSIVSVGGLTLYLLQFPTAGQTWVYDFKNDVWCRWGKWDEVNGVHDNFIGQHACFVKTWNKHLIMSRIDGKIYEMSRDFFDDDGSVMVSYRRTGWIDHGSMWKRKRSDQLYIKLKVKERLIDPNTGEPEVINMLMRFRDNGNPDWSKYVEMPLNPDYQGDCLVKLNRMGTYRTRQYEFRLSDGVDMVLVGADETVAMLMN